MNQPISNPYSPAFFFRCCECGGEGRSTDGVTGPEPFTYICWRCQQADLREAVRLANMAQWELLSEGEKRQARLRLYGVVETRQIEARERKRLTSW